MVLEASRSKTFLLLSVMQHLNSLSTNHQYTNNWHWTDKDISPQFNQRIMDSLKEIGVKVDNVKVIEAVLHRRKGKLYLIFEVVLDGTCKNGISFSINEWDHDTSLQETCSCSNAEDKAQIIKCLEGLDEELKQVHGKDLGVEETAKRDTIKVTSTKVESVSTIGASGSIAIKDTLFCSNEQFIDLFTKPEMIQMWSRNILKVIQLHPIEGTLGHVHFKNVKSTIDNNKVSITMDWKLNTWSTHKRCLLVKSDNQVVISMTCPDKDMVSQIFKEKYLHAIKSIFGF